MRAGLLEQGGPVGRGERQGPGAHLHGCRGVEVQVDEVGGFDVRDVLEVVEDLGAARRAGPVPPRYVLALDFRYGSSPFGVGVGEDGQAGWLGRLGETFG